MVSFILPGNSATGGYNVANSCRFNSGDSAYLTRSGGTATNEDICTFSVWLKKCNIDAYQRIFTGDSDTTGRDSLYFLNGELIMYFANGSDGEVDTSDREYRDPSAWLNLVVACDTTQGVAANRIKFYINGVQQTLSGTQPSQNLNLGWNNNGTVSLGTDSSSPSEFYDGYMAEVVFIDGQQLDPTSFGEFDSDSPTVWKPIDVSGLTFGNNGFYLDFEDSSALGNDVSGNNNDFTSNNLAATDQSTDTCTNNYATLNPLDVYYYNGTFSEGNLQTTTATSEYGYLPANIGVSLGKWYCEIEWDAKSGGGGAGGIGITSTQSTASNIQLGQNANDYKWYGPDGNVYNNNSGIVSLSTFSTGDIVGIYLDLDNNKLYFAKNGTIQNSGTGISITDPASTTLGFYFFAIDYASSSYTGTFKANFGNPITTISSGNSDPNGYGNFEYSPNDGGSASFDSSAKNFYALNSKNLAEFG